MDENEPGAPNRDDHREPSASFFEDPSSRDPQPARDEEHNKLLPDPIPEQPERHALAHQFESLPHHPAHLLDRFLYLPPFAGLVDLTRTLLHRRRNPFYHALLRRFWGRRPWFVLSAWVIGLGLATIPINYLLVEALNGPLAPVMKYSVSFYLIPYFLTGAAFYLAALFGARTVRLLREPASQSELEMLPNARTSMIRAIAVQLLAASVLLTIFSHFTSRFYVLLNSSVRAATFPPGTPSVEWLVFALGLPKEISYAPAWILVLTKTFCEEFLTLGILVLAFTRGRTVPQSIGLALLAGYALQLYSYAISRATSALSGWLAQQVPAHPVSWRIMSVVALTIHLLVIGAIWHWFSRRAAREDQSVADPAPA